MLSAIHPQVQREDAAIGRRDLINFSFYLEQLVRAGVPILEPKFEIADITCIQATRDKLAAGIDRLVFEKWHV